MNEGSRILDLNCSCPACDPPPPPITELLIASYFWYLPLYLILISASPFLPIILAIPFALVVVLLPTTGFLLRYYTSRPPHR